MDLFGEFSGAARCESSSAMSSFRIDDDAAMASTSYKDRPNLNDLLVEDDDDDDDEELQVLGCVEKKKQVVRMKGCGLRVFSTKVCTKIQAKGRTTINEVADEIISELRYSCKFFESEPEFDVKNIRRRVYDAFNVLMSINIIAKDKKEYVWIGFPATKADEINKLKADEINKLKVIRECMIKRMNTKAILLKELQEHYADLENLIFHNRRRAHELGSQDISSKGIFLPFLLVQTSPHAAIEIKISNDKKRVNFDFESAPFKLLNDAALLAAMRSPRMLDAASGNPAAGGSLSSSTAPTGPRGDPSKPVYFAWNSENFSFQ